MIVITHIDHIHPIAAGGTNAPDNLQLLCARCNSRKGARPFEYLLKEPA